MRNVLDDEAQEVRELLEDNKIEYFETFAGNWGVSLPAIWLKNDDQHEMARSLLDEYQAERAVRIRKEYELGRQRGEIQTIWHTFIENPIKLGTTTVRMEVPQIKDENDAVRKKRGKLAYIMGLGMIILCFLLGFLVSKVTRDNPTQRQGNLIENE